MANDSALTSDPTKHLEDALNALRTPANVGMAIVAVSHALADLQRAAFLSRPSDPTDWKLYEMKMTPEEILDFATHHYCAGYSVGFTDAKDGSPHRANDAAKAWLTPMGPDRRNEIANESLAKALAASRGAKPDERCPALCGKGQCELLRGHENSHDYGGWLWDDEPTAFLSRSETPGDVPTREDFENEMLTYLMDSACGKGLLIRRGAPNPEAWMDKIEEIPVLEIEHGETIWNAVTRDMAKHHIDPKVREAASRRVDHHRDTSDD